MDPNNKYILNNKGNALFVQGNYRQAIQYYDKALVINTNSTIVLTSKGAVLFTTWVITHKLYNSLTRL